MTTILRGWYVGDRVLEYLLIVAAGVLLLSTFAWLVSGRLSRRPAGRHLVLVSGLLGCLALPLLAGIVSAGGFTLIAIPLLPAPPARVGLVPLLRSSSFPPTGTPLSRPPLAEASPWPEPGRMRRPQTLTVPRVARPEPTAEQQAVAGSPRASSLSLHALASLCLLVWGAGSVVLGCRLAWGWRLVQGLRRAAAPLENEDIRRMTEEAGRLVQLPEPPPVLVSSQVVTPVAIGILHPAVILPARLLDDADASELLDVLVHELAHVRRHDTLAVVLQELARVLYWPILSMHLLARALGRAREELCDNYVLQHRDALGYGETLLHLADLSRTTQPLVGAIGILQWTGDLERRIAGLLREGRSTMTRSNRWLVCAVGLLFLTACVITSSTRFVAGKVLRPYSAPTAPVPVPIPVPQAARPEPHAGRTMRVHVLGPDGQPMAGVKIHRSVWTRKPGARGNMDYLTDEHGGAVVDIPEGIYIVRLWARIAHHVPLFAHWEESDVPEKNLPAEFTFRMRNGTTIGGIIRNSAGLPIQGAQVDVMLAKGGQSEGRTGPDMWLSEHETPVTDAQGKWSLDNIPASLDLDLRLKLRHPDYVSDREWGESQQAQGIDLKALRSRQAVMVMKGGLIASGTVTDPDGKPVARAVVVRGDNPYLEVDSQEVLTDDHGRYVFPPLTAGPLNITVMAPGWMPALRTVQIKQGMEPFDFRLQRGKTLRIRFVDTAGKPIPGVYVGIAKWRGGKSLYNHRHPNVLNTQIPVQADANGVYLWDWAPDDAVTYSFGKEGFATALTMRTADSTDQTVTLPRITRFEGRVTDAATGQPIRGFVALRVADHGRGQLMVERFQAKGPFDETYQLEGDRTDIAYRVRIEADGYRAAMSEPLSLGARPGALDFRLQKAAPLAGRLVDGTGKPIPEVRVYLATPSQGLYSWAEDQNTITDSLKVLTDDQGRFSFSAQFERCTLVAVGDRGYAELSLGPNDQPGDLTLRDWAHVEGRVFQAGQPVPDLWVTCRPIRLSSAATPHFQDQISVKTDREGRFVFPRVPPVNASIQAQLSVWNDSPLRSSESLPLELKPGDHRTIDFGNTGTVVKGRVVLSGVAAAKVDLHRSLNWLLRKEPGNAPPAMLAALGFNARNGWNHAWTGSREGLSFIESLHTFMVVLEKDGRFAIHGVPAGDYDLALRPYASTEGCLINPVGAKVVSFQVSESAAKSAAVDLGEIPVTVALGPRKGEIAPDFPYTDSAGKIARLSMLRGRYVLVDFWATWCAPCVASLPELTALQKEHATGDRLTILSVSIDDDPARARAFLEERKLSWPQGFLGGTPGKDEILTQYGIGSVPAYLLIGPDGTVIERSETLKEITDALRRL